MLNTGRHLSDERLQRRLTTDDGNDPNGFGLWICHEFAVRYGGGFTAAPDTDIPQPYTTLLSFWLPNQTCHDRQKPAAD
jgi:hypothetical protein